MIKLHLEKLGKSYLIPEASVIVSEGERSQDEIEMTKGGALTDRITYLLTYPLTHSLTHSLVLTYLITHLLTYLLTHLLTHLPTHSYSLT